MRGSDYLAPLAASTLEKYGWAARAIEGVDGGFCVGRRRAGAGVSVTVVWARERLVFGGAVRAGARVFDGRANAGHLRAGEIENNERLRRGGGRSCCGRAALHNDDISADAFLAMDKSTGVSLPLEVLVRIADMTPLARRLGQALLDHHKNHCRALGFAPEEITEVQVRQNCVTYADICLRVGGLMPRFAGPFLDEIGRWCQKNHWPSLPSLVVNGKTGVPGPGYANLHAGGVAEWQKQVRRCIAFKEYPDTMPPMM